MELGAHPTHSRGSILVVTGWRNAGKTTFCQNVIEQFRSDGLRVAGLLTPGRFDEQGEKTGIYALDLSRDVSRLFASRLKGEIDGISIGCWTFDPDVFSWGNQQLENSTDTDLLVVDELGPLEFDQKQGWNAAFRVLELKRFGNAVVVIRPECLEAFSKMGFAYELKEVSSPREFARWT